MLRSYKPCTQIYAGGCEAGGGIQNALFALNISDLPGRSSTITSPLLTI